MSRVSGACMAALVLASLAGAARAQVADRYGPTAPSYDVSAAQAGPSDVLAGAPVRMLSWPGKVTPSAPVSAPEASAVALRPAFAPARSAAAAPPRAVQMASASVAPGGYRAARYAAPPVQAPIAQTPVAQTPVVQPPHTQATGAARYGLVQAYPSQGEGPTARAPTIYDPAPDRSDTPARAQAAARPATAAGASADPVQAASADPAHPGWAPPRRPWSQASDSGVRFYSLHRQYGVKPDPAPIPPQFFAASADLGEPAGPMTRTLSGAGSAAQTARAVQAAQSETASDPASSAP